MALLTETERTAKWDAFLDCYSRYLSDPSPSNGAWLHLAGIALEKADPKFVLGVFENDTLNWFFMQNEHEE